jgi:hypothetical protein
MSRSLIAAAIAFVAVSSTVHAQPNGAPDQVTKAVNAYVYMMDSGGNKVLVSTQFWRNDVKYDDRAFHRFLDVLAGLDKRGFRKDDKATIDDWDKPEPIARCWIYMEDLQSGKGGKGAVVSGSRVWCSSNGVSEKELSGSDNAKHAEQVLQTFDAYLARAKKNLKK